MQRCKPYATSVAKKIGMALSGVGLFGFLVGHLYGNLKVFYGREVFNAYAEGLRDIGHPLLGHGHALLVARLGLLAIVGYHLWAACDLTLRSRRARPQPYARHEDISLSYASRAMVYGGIWLGLYIVFHLLHLTFGMVGPEHAYLNGGRLDVYANVVNSFRIVWIDLVYLVSMVPLGLHLYHGLWSATQTLGLACPQLNPLRRPAALAIAALMVAGYCSIPIAVMLGVVR